MYCFYTWIATLFWAMYESSERSRISWGNFTHIQRRSFDDFRDGLFFGLGCNIWLFWQARKFALPGTLLLHPYTRVYTLTSPKTSLFSAHMYTHVDIISCAQLRLQACLVLTALWWPREEGLILAPSPSLGPMPWLQELGGRCHAGAQCVVFLWPKRIAFNA